MSQQLTSGERLSHALATAQDADPRAATLPNMCSNEMIQLGEDGLLVRCFSVSLRRPHDLPPDRWELVTLPNELPPVSQVKRGCKVDNRRVMVDHITFGLMGDHRLQAAVGAKGEILAIRMYPPNEDVDAGEYWSGLADRIKSAAHTKPLIEE